MMKKWKYFNYIKLKYLEAFIWIAALLILAISPISEGHYSLCIFKNLGIDFCPGCGLGHSIHYFFRGEFEASFYAHPLGIIVVGVLLIRIFNIFKQNKKLKPV